METAPPAPSSEGAAQAARFTPYQKFIVAILAFLQFTIVLDFMILSPLGAILLQDLGISTQRFGLVVSVYAFAAGTSGLLAAGFADRFDRKKLLLFFYCGFVLGTFLCGIANSFTFLLLARLVTGLFGGVVGSIAFAIITDLFPFQMRGRVMGTVQTAFAASQVLGLPIGLALATHFTWHAPFLMIVGLSAVAGLVIFTQMRPIDAHLKVQSDRNPFQHLLHTATRPRYLVGFSATMLLATGGFMLMPFGSAFSVHNLGVPLTKLPLVYVVTGVVSIIAGPLMGKASDAIGKYTMFCVATVVCLGVVVYFTHLGLIPLWQMILINAVLFVCITGRMISAGALASGVPAMPDRGAYMAINSSLQQLSGGLAASVAGLIVVQSPSGKLERYDLLGWVVAAAMTLTLLLMYNVHRIVREKTA
ncbi:MAG TPA: MFS transporter [Polyangia bacterium]|jgi:predicted MFS family arabinose efflux permease|nr:MFS transporter [Polyangia bacterium]